MAGQAFRIGDRVLVAGTDDAGDIFKIEGDGATRQYWIDRGLTAHSRNPGQKVAIVESEDADGAFDAIGPFTADQLEPWY